jgi:glycosyltransferase involved in cell wall biosynthesis
LATAGCRTGPTEGAQGLEDRVHFLGQRMDVPDLLRASDMLILPSDNEALPTVLIEAGASALPVVATCVGGIPEIVEDSATGMLIPPRDPAALAGAIRRLVDDPALAQAMGQHAYERVRSIFTLPNQDRQPHCTRR